MFTYVKLSVAHFFIRKQNGTKVIVDNTPKLFTMFLICIFLKNFSDNEFYIFGGQHGYPDQDEDFIEGNNSEIYKLNLVTLKWTHLELIDKALRPLSSEKG